MKKIIELKHKSIEITRSGEFKAYFKGENDDKYQDKLRFIVHKPNLDFIITIKAVLDDQSVFDLEAILEVQKQAKNTNTYLKLDCLLLSDQARARIIPSLEIKEDAVKSGHGATVSQIDKDQFEYLQSRGLSGQESQKLIVESFLNF